MHFFLPLEEYLYGGMKTEVTMRLEHCKAHLTLQSKAQLTT